MKKLSPVTINFGMQQSRESNKELEIAIVLMCMPNFIWTSEIDFIVLVLKKSYLCGLSKM